MIVSVRLVDYTRDCDLSSRRRSKWLPQYNRRLVATTHDGEVLYCVEPDTAVYAMGKTARGTEFACLLFTDSHGRRHGVLARPEEGWPPIQESVMSATSPAPMAPEFQAAVEVLKACEEKVATLENHLRQARAEKTKQSRKVLEMAKKYRASLPLLDAADRQ